MKQGLLIVFCTAAVFAAGFGARLWTEGVQPVPAAPVAAVVAATQTVQAAANSRAQIVERIQRWVADSGEFSKGVTALEAEFEAAFNALLTPRNQQARTEWQQGRGSRGGPGRSGGPVARGGEPRPMSDAEFERLRRAPLVLVARMLAVDEAVELRVQMFALDADQQARTRALLTTRRDKFIALTEGISAMGIQYSALAQEIDRLKANVDAPAAEPKPAARP
jgi:hypothetical protein